MTGRHNDLGILGWNRRNWVALGSTGLNWKGVLGRLEVTGNTGNTGAGGSLVGGTGKD